MMHSRDPRQRQPAKLGINKFKRENPSFRGKQLRQLKEEGWKEFDRRQEEAELRRQLRD